jgi:hypothetical protein
MDDERVDRLQSQKRLEMGLDAQGNVKERDDPMKIKSPMLDNQPDLQAQLECVEFTPEVAEQIGGELLDLMRNATPAQTVKIEFQIGKDEGGKLVVVRYAMALVGKEN